jgi:hypothetical protein
MNEQMSPKHTNLAVWLIAIIIIALIVAGFFIVKSKKESESKMSQEPVATPVVTPPSVTAPVVRVNPEQPQISGQVYIKSIPAVRVGGLVEADVWLDTGESNITLAQVHIDYDPQVLEYQEFVTADSVLPMPLQSRAEGSLVFVARGAQGDADWQDSDDGFTGTGLFGKFVFRALNSGETRLNLAQHNTKMYLDDGYGTEVEISLNGTEVEIR